MIIGDKLVKVGSTVHSILYLHKTISKTSYFSCHSLRNLDSGMSFAALSLPVLDCLGYGGLVGYGGLSFSGLSYGGLAWDKLGFDALSCDALGCNGVGCARLRSVGLGCNLQGCGKLGSAGLGCNGLFLIG